MMKNEKVKKWIITSELKRKEDLEKEDLEKEYNLVKETGDKELYDAGSSAVEEFQISVGSEINDLCLIMGYEKGFEIFDKGNAVHIDKEMDNYFMKKLKKF